MSRPETANRNLKETGLSLRQTGLLLSQPLQRGTLKSEAPIASKSQDSDISDGATTSTILKVPSKEGVSSVKTKAS